MAISLQRYVDIISGVGAGAAVSTRELIGRFFTTNDLVPTDSQVSMTTAGDVATYFGSDSEEYERAVFWFGWTSKSVTSPKKISFARWSDEDVPSTIYGKVGTYNLADFTGVTDGDFTLTLGGSTAAVTGVALNLAASLADVAAAVETAIQENSEGGAAWTGATVTYNATRGSFDFVSGDTGNDTIAVTAGTTDDIASLLGWLDGAILSNGQDTQTITEVLTTSADASNNFGSFTFIDELTLDEVTEAAEWNLAQNVMFKYSVAVTPANASAWEDALGNIGGTTLTLSDVEGQYPEQMPMMILAATNYNSINGTQNYMFQQFNLTPSVSTNANADIYDNLRINYYGQTQTAGQLISFYQRGVMMGLPTDPLDQNTYANEIWLKDALSASIMTLLLALPKVSANSTGRSQILGNIQGVITQAVLNGTISIGKPLTDTQKSYITSLTLDDKAWQDVFNRGFWIDVNIESFVEDSVTRYKAVYTLIYSKDDIIRKVEGRDILI